MASALDAALLDSLRAVSRIESIQPYLMAAFNLRRTAIGREASWLVVQEPSRLTIALIKNEQWKLVRVRQAVPSWQASLADMLDREAAIASAVGCTRAVVCSEEELPTQVGRYEV